MTRMVTLTATLIIVVLALASLATADVPQMINYQGRLTDGTGSPVADGPYLINFKIYGSAAGDDSLWYSGFKSVTVTDGLFTYQLGTSPSFPHDLFEGDTTRYLGITVMTDDEITERTKIISVAYAYHALRADSAQYAAEAASVTAGSIGATEVKSNEVQLRVDGTCPPGYYISQVNEDGSVICVEDQFGGSNWSVTDSVLYTNNYWGIARGGADNLLYGSNAYTMVNLGIACTTGTSPFSPTYSTVGGGSWNVADHNYCTVAGGIKNRATAHGVTIGGGRFNEATESDATIAGGYSNIASGSRSTIGGGRDNSASYYSTVGGGKYNDASGDYSTIGGGSENATAGNYSIIGGGELNVANGNRSTVGGGSDNTAAGDYTTVGGGKFNKARGAYSVIAGGGGSAESDSNATLSQYCTVGGGSHNVAVDAYCTVSGGLNNYASGANSSTIGGGTSNSIISSPVGTIAGGQQNTIDNSAAFAVIGGGDNNSASASGAIISGGSNNAVTDQFGTVSGGIENTVSKYWATVGGGYDNTASGKASTVSGGKSNQALSDYSWIGGGQNNTAKGYGASIPGGQNNLALGDFSFASGNGARANHDGTFVWADASGDPLESTAPNQFLIRAAGGTKIFSNTEQSAGVTIHAGASAWAVNSDRNLKENFTIIDGKELLEKIAALPISKWNYKTQSRNIKHIGPVAQDFHAAFGLGDDDVTISTIDPAGVALAGIKELIEENRQLRNLIETLEHRLEQLEAR